MVAHAFNLKIQKAEAHLIYMVSTGQLESHNVDLQNKTRLASV